jgi:hypothetical protein
VGLGVTLGALLLFSSSLTQLQMLCGVQHCALQTVKQRTARGFRLLWLLAEPVVLCPMLLCM